MPFVDGAKYFIHLVQKGVDCGGGAQLLLPLPTGVIKKKREGRGGCDGSSRPAVFGVGVGGLVCVCGGCSVSWWDF